MGKVIRHPDDIRKDILELEKELLISRDYYKYQFLCNSDFSDDMIGFFNMKKARTILTALQNGELLELRHDAYGTFRVRMNPQRDKILVYKEGEEDCETKGISRYNITKGISGYNIMSFIVWHAGSWFRVMHDD